MNRNTIVKKVMLCLNYQRSVIDAMVHPCSISVVGWGLTSGGGKQSRYLKEALMPIADTKVCQSQFGSVSM